MDNLATAGDRLNFAGTLGYLDAKYIEFMTVVNRNINCVPIAPVEADVADFRKIQNTPKWTLSGTLEYDTPAFGGRLNANTTLSYRSKSQQFELASPGLDQKGFALLDANLVWRSTGDVGNSACTARTWRTRSMWSRATTSCCRTPGPASSSRPQAARNDASAACPLAGTEWRPDRLLRKSAPALAVGAFNF